MIKPIKLNKNDTVALVSLSSNNIADPEFSFRFQLIEKRLKKLGLKYEFSKNSLLPRKQTEDNPNLLAEDLIDCLINKKYKAIIAINGGKNAIETIEYLKKYKNIEKIIQENPKIILGFSDTTIQHFFFYKMGLKTYYGQNVVCDICEQEIRPFKYTIKCFKNLFKSKQIEIKPSKFWYLERPTYDKSQLFVKRNKHLNKTVKIYNLEESITGELLGGCIERLNSMLEDERFKIFDLFPRLDDWQNKILFLESCDYDLNIEKFKTYLKNLEKFGLFLKIKGLLYGRNPNENLSNECFVELKKIAQKYNLPLVYNLNIGHAAPRAIIPYGSTVSVNKKAIIKVLEPFVASCADLNK